MLNKVQIDCDLEVKERMSLTFVLILVFLIVLLCFFSSFLNYFFKVTTVCQLECRGILMLAEVQKIIINAYRSSAWDLHS